MTEEALFYTDGTCNVHNEHHYAPEDENPHCTEDVHFQGRQSVSVWGGVLYDRVIGPYFFQHNVNAQTYCELLTDHLPGLLQGVPEIVRESMWFQQDGHPAHR